MAASRPWAPETRKTEMEPLGPRLGPLDGASMVTLPAIYTHPMRVL